MNYAKKAFYGTIWMFISGLIVSGISYGFRILLARKLNVKDYGLFFAVFSFIAFLFIFRDLGLSASLTKFIPEYNIKKQQGKISSAIIFVLIIQLSSFIIFGVIMFLSRKYLATNYFQNPVASSLLLIFIFYFLISGLTLTFKSVVLGHHGAKYAAISEVIRTGLLITVTYLFITLGLGVMAPAIAHLISWFITLIYILIISFRHLLKIKKWNKVKKWNKEIIKNHIIFGLSMTVASFGGRVISYLDTLILTYFSTLTKVGIYNVVLPSALLILLFSGALAPVIIPIISELWTKKEIAKIRGLFDLLYRYTLMFVLPISLTIIIFASDIIRLLFGNVYVTGASSLVILVFGATLMLLASLNNIGLSSMGHPQKVTKHFLTAAGMNLILNITMIPWLGIIGAAIATSISYGLLFILSARSLSKLIAVKVPIKNWAHITAAGITFIVISWLMKSILNINLILEITISVVTASLGYVAYLLLLGLINKKEIMHYKKLILE